MAPDAEFYRELVRPVVAGRKMVLAGAPLAQYTRRAHQLRELGARSCLCIAGGTGTGELPDLRDAEWVMVDVDAPGMVSSLRRWEAVLADPPPEVDEALDRYDPAGEALVLTSPFHASSAIGRRPIYGGRRPAWVGLEDKTLADAFFDAAGVRRPPSEVVAPDRGPLTAAARRLDRGSGTVWSGDAHRGFNGAGEYVRWIRRPADGEESVAFFADRCRAVRVAPFVEGRPCSIHGVVTDDGVAALRPVELVMLRTPAGTRFSYAGVATFWDPPPDDRETMRAVARRVGRELSAQVGFRGAFGVDGILGEDGFVPTELNPRFAAGLGYVAAAAPGLPFEMVHRLLAAGDGRRVEAGDLEALIVEGADRRRWGAGWSTTAVAWSTTGRTELRYEGGRCRPADLGEEPDATLLHGPSASGGFVRVELDGARTPVGPSIAGRVVAALAVADAELGAGIGSLSAAVDLR